MFQVFQFIEFILLAWNKAQKKIISNYWIEKCIDTKGYEFVLHGRHHLKDIYLSFPLTTLQLK